MSVNHRRKRPRSRRNNQIGRNNAAVRAGGCATVPQNQRKHLADPMMNFEVDSLDAAKRQKFYDTREGAAGGDGLPAGGGCGCQ